MEFSSSSELPVPALNYARNTYDDDPVYSGGPPGAVRQIPVTP